MRPRTSYAAALGACAVAAILGGCGGAAHKKRAATARAPASGCVHAVAAAFAANTGARTVTTTPTEASPGERGCRYVARGAVATITVDSNPQAFLRFNKTVEERDQALLWSGHPEDAPRTVSDAGRGADWFPRERLLLSSDGKRLVSVEIRTRHHPRRTARALTLATLKALAAARP